MPRGAPLADEVRGEQRADLVAAEHAPAAVAAVGHGHGAAVGVGVVGDDEVRAGPRRAVSKARSIAPGSSGLGNATVGKAGSGSACSATRTGAGKPARAKAAVSDVLPTPCMAV